MKTLNIQTYPTPLSRVCLGTASMGENGLVGEPLTRAFAILDRYYSLGGRFLDTANVYGRWGTDHVNASERVIGQWLRDRKITDMTVTTKACHYALDAPSVSRVDRASLHKDVEESRASLGMDRLDILLLHRDNESVDIREIVDFCVPLVDAGKVTRFGFSNFRANRVKTAIETLGADWTKYFVGVSNEQSLAMDGTDTYTPGAGMVATDAALLQLQRTYNFALLPFSSIAHGFFAKLQTCGATFDGEWHNTDNFRGNRAWLTAKNGDAYNALCRQSTETGISVGMLSLKYLLDQPGTIPLMSVSRPDQLDELTKLL